MGSYATTSDSNWDFRGENTKYYTHCFHNYPAIMIPQIARRLIRMYEPKDVSNKILSIHFVELALHWLRVF